MQKLNNENPCSGDDCLVFQYGSNCSDERLNSKSRLGGDAKCPELAYTVEKFDLVFSRKTKCGHAAADIVDRPTTGRQIYGVLYKIPECRIFIEKKQGNKKTLDEIELEGIAYRRTLIRVIHDGKEKQVITYVVINKVCGIKTTCCYVEHIFDGLRGFLKNNDDLEEYIQYLKKQVKANNPGINVDEFWKV